MREKLQVWMPVVVATIILVVLLLISLLARNNANRHVYSPEFHSAVKLWTIHQARQLHALRELAERFPLSALREACEIVGAFTAVQNLIPTEDMTRITGVRVDRLQETALISQAWIWHLVRMKAPAMFPTRYEDDSLFLQLADLLPSGSAFSVDSKLRYSDSMCPQNHQELFRRWDVQCAALKPFVFMKPEEMDKLHELERNNESAFKNASEAYAGILSELARGLRDRFRRQHQTGNGNDPKMETVGAINAGTASGANMVGNYLTKYFGGSSNAQ